MRFVRAEKEGRLVSRGIEMQWTELLLARGPRRADRPGPVVGGSVGLTFHNLRNAVRVGSCAELVGGMRDHST